MHDLPRTEYIGLVDSSASKPRLDNLGSPLFLGDCGEVLGCEEAAWFAAEGEMGLVWAKECAFRFLLFEISI